MVFVVEDSEAEIVAEDFEGNVVPEDSEAYYAGDPANNDGVEDIRDVAEDPWGTQEAVAEDFEGAEAAEDKQ